MFSASYHATASATRPTWEAASAAVAAATRTPFAAAAAGAVTPLGAAAAQLYALYNAEGHAEADFSGIIEMLRGK